MYSSLDGKVALVTGAGAGIGQAIAVRLGREGCTVAVNDVRDDRLSETVRLVEQSGGRVSAWAGDMTEEGAVQTVVDGVVAMHGCLDILVNNVGLFTFGDLTGLAVSGWQRGMDLNVTSAFLCSRAAIPHLRASRGVIVNMSSGAGKIGGTNAGGYSAAKWAVIGLTRSLAAELAPAVRVNAVCPGFIATQMDADYVTEAAAARGKSTDEFLRERLANVPLGRDGMPEDVAKAVAFLCSDEASYTTGEAFNVSGGMVMH